MTGPSRTAANPYALGLFSVFLSTRDDDIGPCMGPPIARPLIHQDGIIYNCSNGQNAACNTDRPGES